MTREPSLFVSLASCPPGPVVQEEPSAETGRASVEELEQVWVSRPISFVPPMLSLFRPMLSPGHPTPFSVERVVVRQLNLVFGTSREWQERCTLKGPEGFSCHESILLFFRCKQRNERPLTGQINLAALRWEWSWRSQYNRFDLIATKALDICENGNQCH